MAPTGNTGGCSSRSDALGELPWPPAIPGGQSEAREEPRSRRGRGRGNSRGRGRRGGRGERPENTPPASPQEGGSPESFTMSESESQPPESSPPPREPGADDSPYMTSAEHRTEEDPTESRGSQGESSIDEEICFQPREPRRPVQAPPAAEESFRSAEPAHTMVEEESAGTPEPMQEEGQGAISRRCGKPTVRGRPCRWMSLRSTVRNLSRRTSTNRSTSILAQAASCRPRASGATWRSRRLRRSRTTPGGRDAAWGPRRP